MKWIFDSVIVAHTGETNTHGNAGNAYLDEDETSLFFKPSQINKSGRRGLSPK